MFRDQGGKFRDFPFAKKQQILRLAIFLELQPRGAQRGLDLRLRVSRITIDQAFEQDFLESFRAYAEVH